jgi:hypothetical protein
VGGGWGGRGFYKKNKGGSVRVEKKTLKNCVLPTLVNRLEFLSTKMFQKISEKFKNKIAQMFVSHVSFLCNSSVI